MTISVGSRKAGPHLGDGRIVDYPFVFKVFSGDDILLYVADKAGAEKVIDKREYTVTLNTDQEHRPGGFVRLNSPLPDGYKLSIISSLPIEQPTELTNQGGFYPTVINDCLDRLTIYCQQIEEILNRCIKGGVNSESSLPPLPLPKSEHFIRWSKDATALESYDIGLDNIVSDISSLKRAVQALNGGGDALELHRLITAAQQEIAQLKTNLQQQKRDFDKSLRKVKVLALAGL